MKRKEHNVKQYEDTTKELLKDAPAVSGSPVLKELEKLKKSFTSVQNQLVDMKTVLDESLKDLLELHTLLQGLYKVMDDIDDCINKSSDALDGDEHDLETCLNVSHTQYYNNVFVHVFGYITASFYQMGSNTSVNVVIERKMQGFLYNYSILL